MEFVKLNIMLDKIKLTIDILHRKCLYIRKNCQVKGWVAWFAHYRVRMGVTHDCLGHDTDASIFGYGQTQYI